MREGGDSGCPLLFYFVLIMKKLLEADRQEIYEAPIIDWNNNTYTPISNKYIMDLIEEQIDKAGLVVKNTHFTAARTTENKVKGVIGGYDIMTDDEEFGQRLMFRNSYDKSMSFAVVVGGLVWICSNGCISGDYQYKRAHRGVLTAEGSTTSTDIYDNIMGGFSMAVKAFEHNRKQLNDMKEIKVAQSTAYDIIGQLFFKQKILTMNQLSIIKDEFMNSLNFRHLTSPDFTAYDLYNHITESLKISHPINYFNNHIETHKVFEETFGI